MCKFSFLWTNSTSSAESLEDKAHFVMGRYRGPGLLQAVSLLSLSLSRTSSSDYKGSFSSLLSAQSWSTSLHDKSKFLFPLFRWVVGSFHFEVEQSLLLTHVRGKRLIFIKKYSHVDYTVSIVNQKSCLWAKFWKIFVFSFLRKLLFWILYKRAN